MSATGISRGSFLVASPDLDTPVLQRSVVLVCEHSPEASFGLVINKPIHVDIPSELLNLDQALNPPIGLRAGGPLHPHQMMMLHTQRTEMSLEILPGLFLGGDLPFLQQAIANPSGPQMMLCFGYTSWGPGQLEHEIYEGSWIISNGAKEDLLEAPSHILWAEFLRRAGGKYGPLSMMPEDLSLN